jgi:hypothetical protein
VQFTDHNLNYQRTGSVVVVQLQGTEANVQLVDQANFDRYRSGQSYNYVGGHYKSSPVRLTIPSDGHWQVVVDLGGLGGQVRSAVQVMSRQS